MEGWKGVPAGTNVCMYILAGTNQYTYPESEIQYAKPYALLQFLRTLHRSSIKRTAPPRFITAANTQIRFDPTLSNDRFKPVLCPNLTDPDTTADGRIEIGVITADVDAYLPRTLLKQEYSVSPGRQLGEPVRVA